MKFGDVGNDPFMKLMLATMGHIQIERQVANDLGLPPGAFQLVEAPDDESD